MSGTTAVRVVQDKQLKYPLVRLTGSGPRPQAVVADHLLVTLRSGITARDIAQRTGTSVRRVFRAGDRALLSFPCPDAGTLARMQALVAADPGVLRVSVDPIIWTTAIPTDPLFAQQWSLSNNQTPGADINATTAWNIRTDASSVPVAVIDTGVSNHIDLADQLWTNVGESGVDANGADKRTNGIDDDGNGFVDDWRGWDFANEDNNVLDGDAHGSHVAGTIGATGNNAVGVSGICWKARIMSIKFLQPTGFCASGTTSDAIESIEYAIAAGAKVINASWGSDSYSEELREVIHKAGDNDIAFVTAAGNDGWDSEGIRSYPANYQESAIINVGASTSLDLPAYFSNYSATSVHLFAPGYGILSTLPGGNYDYYSGTSMAAPHVAGSLVLMRAHNPGRSMRALADILLATTDARSALSGLCTTGGRLDIGNAMLAINKPAVDVVANTITDLGTTKDGVANPGESIDVRLTVRNTGATTLNGLTASILSADPVFSTLIASTNLTALTPGQSRVTAPVRLRISSTASVPSHANLVMRVSNGTTTIDYPLTVQVSLTARIAGQVRRAGSNAIIPGASVAIQGTKALNVVTNSQGRFNVAVPHGAYGVEASANGLSRSLVRSLSVPPNDLACNFLLGQPAYGALSPIAITVAEGQSASTAVTFANAGDGPLRLEVEPTHIPAGYITTSGLWHRTNRQASDGVWSWGYCREQDGQFHGPRSTGDLIIHDVKLPATTCVLTYKTWRNADVTGFYDFGNGPRAFDGRVLDGHVTVFGASYDGKTWVDWDFEGSIYESDERPPVHGWVTQSSTIQLSDWNRPVKLRFRFDSVRGSEPQEIPGDAGWFIDDIRINGQPLGNWLNVSPAQQDIPAQGSVNATAIGAASDLEVGTYTTSITLTERNGLLNATTRPVTVTVAPAARPVIGWIEVDDVPGNGVIGNGNGKAEAGETVRITPHLMNLGTVGTAVATAEVVSKSLSFATVVSGAKTVTWPALAAVGRQRAATGALISIKSTLPDGSPTVNLLFKHRIGTGPVTELTGSFALTSKPRFGLTGTVINGTNGQPVVGLFLAVSRGAQQFSAHTDDQGNYTIPVNLAGNYSLYSGYTPGFNPISTTTVNIQSFQSLNLLMSAPYFTTAQTQVNVTTTPGQVGTGTLVVDNAGNLPTTWSATRIAYTARVSSDPYGPVYAWQDIAIPANRLTFPTPQTAVGPLTLPFTFTFYGLPMQQIWVAKNGNMGFASGITTTYSIAPSRHYLYTSGKYETGGGIAAYQGNLVMNADSAIYAAALNAQTYVVQWTNMALTADPSRKATFQTILKADGSMRFQYQRVDQPGLGSTYLIKYRPFSTDAYGVFCIQAAADVVTLQNGMAIEVIPGLTWMTPPATGVVAPFSSATMTIQAGNLATPGVYRTEMNINAMATSNAAGELLRQIPVTCEVLPGTNQ